MAVRSLRYLTSLIGCLLAVFTLMAHAQPPDTNGPVLSEAELDQMLAPIALYPDALLSQVLMAATYPLEVEEAAHWSIANPALAGEKAVTAAADQDWDQSIKALVAFPDLLARMADDREWTRRLGDAYLAQEGDVIDRIQVLREQAYSAGHLNDMEYQRAYRERDVIIIEPVNPRLLYIPYYQPRSVYDSWHWPAHPAHHWRAPGGFRPDMAFYWGPGVPVSPLFFFSTVHWHDRHIVMFDRYQRSYPHTVGRSIYSTRPDWTRRWYHDPHHRRGMIYSNATVRQRFLRHPGYHWYGHGLPTSHSRRDYAPSRRDYSPRRELIPAGRGDWRQPGPGAVGYPPYFRGHRGLYNDRPEP